MLNRLLDMFGGDRPAAPDDDPEAALHRAAAALLAVTARIDGTFDAAEERAVHALIRDRFGLSEAESAALIDRASESAAESTDLFEFTETINRKMPPEKRADIIEMLWEVAYADGTADDYEQNLVRRAAGLLYVSDRDSGLARQRVLRRLGIGTT
jgi:uncharacterized tellurite resistance protein B-like protein